MHVTTSSNSITALKCGACAAMRGSTMHSLYADHFAGAFGEWPLMFAEVSRILRPGGRLLPETAKGLAFTPQRGSSNPIPQASSPSPWGSRRSWTLKSSSAARLSTTHKETTEKIFKAGFWLNSVTAESLDGLTDKLHCNSFGSVPQTTPPTAGLSTTS